jgi:hypothetical protein
VNPFGKILVLGFLLLFQSFARSHSFSESQFSCLRIFQSLGASYDLDLSKSEMEVSLPAFGTVDWKPYIGKKVTVVFNPQHKIDQVVISQSEASQNVKRAVTQLLKNTTVGWPIRFMTVESGIWMVTSSKKTYYSKIFTSKDSHSLYYNREGKLPYETMMRKQRRLSAPGESPFELTLIHTHPGKGDPINKFDTQATESIAKKAFQEMPTLKVVTLYAIPTKAKGNLYFRYRVFRNEDSAEPSVNSK